MKKKYISPDLTHYIVQSVTPLLQASNIKIYNGTGDPKVSGGLTKENSGNWSDIWKEQ